MFAQAPAYVREIDDSIDGSQQLIKTLMAWTCVGSSADCVVRVDIMIMTVIHRRTIYEEVAYHEV